MLTKRFFGDGPPLWRVHRGRPNERACFSAEEADAQRLTLIRSLARSHCRKKDDRVERLIEKLRHCRAEARCLSGACPVCTRALQRWYVEVGAKIGRKMAQTPSQRPRFLSLVPDFGRVQPEQLFDFDIDTFKQRAIEALRRCRISVKLGALDVSLNHWRGDRGGCYYQFQYWALISAVPKQTRDRLAAAANATGEVRKPVLQVKRKWPKAALAYGVKSAFVRREFFYDTSVADRNRAPCINTRARDLLGADLAALTVFLDRRGLHRRLLVSPLDAGSPTARRMKTRQ